jgi:phage-related protein
MQGVADAVGGVSLTEGLYSFRDAARNVFSQVALQGKNLGDVLRTTLGNWFGNAANSLFNAGFDALWGAIGLPSNANGTNDFAGGLTRVNERGGEIMNLPGGTQIIPHDVSMRMASNMGGGVGGLDVTITMDSSTGALGAFVTDRAGQVLARARPAIVSDAVKATYSASREVPFR